jgi:hypothetical protein
VGKQGKPLGWTHSPFLGRFGLSRGVPKKDWPAHQVENEAAKRKHLDLPQPDPRWPPWMSHPCHLGEKPYLCLRGFEAYGEYEPCPDAKWCLFQRLREYQRLSQPTLQEAPAA